MKTVTLTDFLDEQQIEDVVAILRVGGSAQAVCEFVIQPNIDEINRKLGQENDVMYLAYACEYAVRQASGLTQPTNPLP